LDVFTDELRQKQVHDFNLDIRPFPSGVFWTNFIPNSSVSMNDEDGEDGAVLNVENLALFDYFSLGNALSDGNSIDAKVSYHIRWAGDGKPLTIDDGKHFHFRGTSTSATATWSAREAGFHFQSSPAHTTKTNFAVVGSERNGAFYRAG
jgi:hypothetical protein